MPTYEYGCIDCGERFEVAATIRQKEEGLKPGCPKCGSQKTAQIFTTAGVIRGGSGAGSLSPDGCGPGSGSSCCG